MLCVDTESLLRPLPGGSPAGDASHFAMTLAPELRELRREESADEFDDATRPATLKRADWAGVARRCEESLGQEAKDLRTACTLIEARARLDGLAGLAGGFELLARLVDECWDRVTPAVGDDAVESRAVPLANLLDDPDRGVCFPSLLRSLPLIGSEGHLHSYGDWTRMRSTVAGEDNDRLAIARQNTPPERFKQLHEESTEALGWLRRLNEALEDRLGDEAPGLLNLQAALDDVHGLIGEELTRLGYPSEATSTTIDTPTEEAADKAGPLGGNEREQLYTRLEQTAEQLRAMEPHSPIPYLIKRAVRLGRLPFPSLMQHVIREPVVLTEINREFGITEQANAEVLA